MNLHFILIVLKCINAVVVVIILIIHMQNLCIPCVIKNINVKVFNIMSRTNEARHIKWHEICKCK